MNKCVFPFLLVASMPSIHGATVIQTVVLDAARVYESGSLDGSVESTLESVFDDYVFGFDRFDSGLGTLAEVSFSSSVSHTVSATAATVEGVNTQISYGISYSANGFPLTGNGGGGDDNSFVIGEEASVTIDLVATDRQLAMTQFEGAGTVEFTVDTGSVGTGGSIAGFFTDYLIQRNEGAYVTLSYTYDPVPEPSSMMLIVASLMVGSMRRARAR